MESEGQHRRDGPGGRDGRGDGSSAGYAPTSRRFIHAEGARRRVFGLDLGGRRPTEARHPHLLAGDRDSRTERPERAARCPVRSSSRALGWAQEAVRSDLLDTDEADLAREIARSGSETPEIAYDVVLGTRVVAEAVLAWPARRVAVLCRGDGGSRAEGWRLIPFEMAWESGVLVGALGCAGASLRGSARGSRPVAVRAGDLRSQDTGARIESS